VRPAIPERRNGASISTALDRLSPPHRIYARADFERLVGTGHIVQESAESAADLKRRAAAAAWAAAPSSARAIAHARWRAVEVFRANGIAMRRGEPELPIPIVNGSVPGKSTLERWPGASEESNSGGAIACSACCPRCVPVDQAHDFQSGR
jgi:hypothetical protein